MINIQFNKENLIKSPLNYIGSKYNLLPQILPLFPDNINTFVDLFCGGCNVGININANKIICNDIISQTIILFKVCQIDSVENMLAKFQTIIDIYELSRTNKEGYTNLRKDYKQESVNPSNPFGYWYSFYMLIAHSFSNQIRFNKKGEFNLPFGARTFNDNMKDNFIKFVNKIKKLNVLFTNNDFRKVDLDSLTNNDFVYVDPPYSKTTATYNENKSWSKQDDIDLFQLLDNIHKNNIKFAMSNIYKTDWLKEWSKKYNIHYLNYNYKNCNYQKKDKSGKECEVLIANY